MKYWRASLWLLPASTAIPLGYFVHSLWTTDFSSYFAGVSVAGLVVVLGAPNVIIAVVSTLTAFYARRGAVAAALIVVAAICAWQLTLLLWASPFWDSHTRVWYLEVVAVPGAVAAALGVWGWLLLHASNRTVAIVSGILLLIPVVGSGWAVVTYAVESAKECPAGPAVDLEFTGLETGHFTTSCGLSTGISTFTGCNEPLGTTVGLFNGQMWYLIFSHADKPITSDDYPYLGPRFLAGPNTSYGLGSGAWTGSYSYDPGRRCSGTVDAYLYTSGQGGPAAGSVHVKGHFAAP